MNLLACRIQIEENKHWTQVSTVFKINSKGAGTCLRTVYVA